MKYTVTAMNEQGAVCNVGVDMDNISGGKEFTSINAAVRIARGELGAGWKVSIIDTVGETVKEFTIR